MLNRLAILLIHTYRLFGSPSMRANKVRCLRYPTFSEYGLLAFRKHPFKKALSMTRQRVKDCRMGTNRGLIDYP